MQTNAILTAKSTAGKKINTTITYLRPEQKSHASKLAIALNALTTNTYVSTQINEMNINPSESGNKPIPTVTIANKLRVQSNIYILDITYTDIPTSAIRLVGTYKNGSNLEEIYTAEQASSSTYPLPDGVIAQFLLLTTSTYNNATNKNFAFVAPETANYAPLYLDVTNITP